MRLQAPLQFSDNVQEEKHLSKKVIGFERYSWRNRGSINLPKHFWYNRNN